MSPSSVYLMCRVINRLLRLLRLVESAMNWYQAKAQYQRRLMLGRQYHPVAEFNTKLYGQSAVLSKYSLKEPGLSLGRTHFWQRSLGNDCSTHHQD